MGLVSRSKPEIQNSVKKSKNIFCVKRPRKGNGLYEMQFCNCVEHWQFVCTKNKFIVICNALVFVNLIENFVGIPLEAEFEFGECDWKPDIGIGLLETRTLDGIFLYSFNDSKFSSINKIIVKGTEQKGLVGLPSSLSFFSLLCTVISYTFI